MTLTLGTPSTATTLDADFLCQDYQMVTLSTDKCVYVYQDTFTTGDIFARVVSVSGTTISAIGSPTTILSGISTGVWHVAAVSDTQFVIAYRDDSTFGALRAIGASVSGTTITAGSSVAVEGTAGTVSTSADWNVGKVSDGKVIVVYRDRNDTNNGKAKAANVTGSTVGTFGSSHTFTTGAALYLSVDWFYGNGQYCCVTYTDSSPAQVYAQVLSVSGTTVTSGTSLALTSTTETRLTCRVVGMSDTVAIVLWEQTTASRGGKCRAVSRSGTNLSAPGSQANWEGAASGAAIQGGCVRLTSAVAIMNYNNGDEATVELSLSGSTVTPGTALTLVSPGPGDSLGIAFIGTNKVVAIYDTDQIAVITTDLVSTSNVFLLADMTKPADIDRDGAWLYIAMLNNNNPILIQFSTGLDADGSIVFNPGSGTNIGVECSKFDAAIITIAGDFGGTDVVERSIDSAASFSVVDDGAIGAVTGFIVGPLDDNVVLVGDENNDIFETIDGGSSWNTHSTVGYGGTVLAFDRLNTNPKELILGIDESAGDVIFSPDSGKTGDIVLNSTDSIVKGVIIG